jgi:hypothetical protein
MSEFIEAQTFLTPGCEKRVGLRTQPCPLLLIRLDLVSCVTKAVKRALRAALSLAVRVEADWRIELLSHHCRAVGIARLIRLVYVVERSKCEFLASCERGRQTFAKVGSI